MSNEIRNLRPRSVWNKFADLNAVPRPSKKEERVIAFMIDFGESLGFEVIEDSVGNVIIKKPATIGMEDRSLLLCNLIWIWYIKKITILSLIS